MKLTEREELRLVITHELSCGVSDDYLFNLYGDRFSNYQAWTRFLNYTKSEHEKMVVFHKLCAWPCAKCGIEKVVRRHMFSDPSVCSDCQKELETQYEQKEAAKIERKSERAVAKIQKHPVFFKMLAGISQIKMKPCVAQRVEASDLRSDKCKFDS